MDTFGFSPFVNVPCDISHDLYLGITRLELYLTFMTLTPTLKAVFIERVHYFNENNVWGDKRKVWFPFNAFPFLM